MNQVRIIVEAKLKTENEWTEIEVAVNKSQAERLIARRMDILKRSDERYSHKADKNMEGVTNVLYNNRLQRIYRVRETNV